MKNLTITKKLKRRVEGVVCGEPFMMNKWGVVIINGDILRMCLLCEKIKDHIIDIGATYERQGREKLFNYSNITT